MGEKQKLKNGMELDYLYDRRHYCYLINIKNIKKWIRRKLCKRRRVDYKNEMIKEFNDL